ncbi:alpha carbonic anhydrase [Elsinoe ampelina]|uniref:Alpha carbonic anhydrase n=1 Tax=Elsinoe ampelina TaxID=302913 RepID=A0A6A6GQ33_9PEZI|nr:alpha carbonic anhydrase [Elsinoe ampelina]
MRISTIATLVPAATACFQHADLEKRDSGGVSAWNYLQPGNWASLNESYDLCMTGTQQTPINLRTKEGFAKTHKPNFNNVKGSWDGKLYNWGYGPAFKLDAFANLDVGKLPSITFDGETVYIAQWHTHAPSEHTVNGEVTRAEMHFVTVNETGNFRAVFGMRIDTNSTGNPKSAFFAQLPSIPAHTDIATATPLKMDLLQALNEVDFANRYWSYQGSLTVPPCTQGLRWFVAGNVLRVSRDQMRSLLRSGAWSARPIQERWDHKVNV